MYFDSPTACHQEALPFLILKVRYPIISKVIRFNLLLGVVIVMNSNVVYFIKISLV